MTENPLLASNHKFETLDALRGVAALAVVLYHSNALSAHLFRHGYLAVDFFFGLSGFVLSYAYGPRLAGTWKLTQFMRVRFLRLFPLSTVGLLLGTLVALCGISNPPVHEPLSSVPYIIALNMFFVPVHPFDPTQHLFPFNPVAWSLFFELVSNALHALFLRRIKTAPLIALSILTGGIYFARILAAGKADIGYNNLLQIDGFVRVLFSYFVGMLLFRIWQSGYRIVTSPFLICVLLAAVLAIPIPARISGIYDVVCIGCLLPAIVLLGAYGRSDTGYGKVLQSLGASSYAVYILQAPLLSFMEWISVRLSHRSIAANRPWSTFAVLPVIMGAALLADAYFDVPIRRKLRRQKPNH